jgi:hypothetical protein
VQVTLELPLRCGTELEKLGIGVNKGQISALIEELAPIGDCPVTLALL